jgi:hypothetical protein
MITIETHAVSLWRRAEQAAGARDWQAFRDSVEGLLPHVGPRLELLAAFALQLVDEGDVAMAMEVWDQFVDAARLPALGASAPAPP